MSKHDVVKKQTKNPQQITAQQRDILQSLQ